MIIHVPDACFPKLHADRSYKKVPEEYFRFLLTHSRYNWDHRNNPIGDTGAGSLLWPADIAFGRLRLHLMDGNK